MQVIDKSAYTEIRLLLQTITVNGIYSYWYDKQLKLPSVFSWLYMDDRQTECVLQKQLAIFITLWKMLILKITSIVSICHIHDTYPWWDISFVVRMPYWENLHQTMPFLNLIRELCYILLLQDRAKK